MDPKTEAMYRSWRRVLWRTEINIIWCKCNLNEIKTKWQKLLIRHRMCVLLSAMGCLNRILRYIRLNLYCIVTGLQYSLQGPPRSLGAFSWFCRSGCNENASLFALTSNSLMYREEPHGHCDVDIYNMMYEEIANITPLTGREWSHGLSVFAVPDTCDEATTTASWHFRPVQQEALLPPWPGKTCPSRMRAYPPLTFFSVGYKQSILIMGVPQMTFGGIWGKMAVFSQAISKVGREKKKKKKKITPWISMCCKPKAFTHTIITCRHRKHIDRQN